MTRLCDFPEELTERILEFTLKPGPSSRPDWHLQPNRPAPLFVSKTFYRIAVVHLYHTIQLGSESGKREQRLLETLQEKPELARCVRKLVVTSPSSHAANIIRLCRSTQNLEIHLTVSEDLPLLCDAVKTLPSIQYLTLHKPSNVYLTHAVIRDAISALAGCIQDIWGPAGLSAVNIGFKLSSDDSPASSPVTLTTPAQSPVSSLTHALSNAPHLHTFATVLPSVWNDAVLIVSENPRLEKIVLSPSQTGSGRVGAKGGVMSTGLWMNEASKRTRLIELVRCGTPILRHRAHTMGTSNMVPMSKNPGAATKGCPVPVPTSAASSSRQLPLQRRNTMVPTPIAGRVAF
ncbi:hypothetical protein WG66_000216 [Moniliophthora roreri]|uniref:Uncharacterized protein n=1 Tax=Moniliophthora roreri TaxID=221103 RepID=A0A0W0EY17_MONRR|nr:hypothetical protein WG66_000216 [Moniliophthora roreri]